MSPKHMRLFESANTPLSHQHSECKLHHHLRRSWIAMDLGNDMTRPFYYPLCVRIFARSSCQEMFQKLSSTEYTYPSYYSIQLTDL